MDIEINIEMIERERFRKGLTKEKMAEFLGVHPNTYTTLIKGRAVSPETLNHIIQALGLDPDKVIPEPTASP